MVVYIIVLVVYITVSTTNKHQLSIEQYIPSDCHGNRRTLETICSRIESVWHGCSVVSASLVHTEYLPLSLLYGDQLKDNIIIVSSL